jgi:hypothetical protein
MENSNLELGKLSNAVSASHRLYTTVHVNKYMKRSPSRVYIYVYM